MNSVETRIGYSFQDRNLLEAALTHPSYGGDHHVEHYQRLEFLGDAVLELYVSEALFRAYKTMPEGKLTRMRADLVCEAALSQAALRLGLDEKIRVSVGEERSGGRQKPSILCDVMEAVIGAVYLDGGRKAAGELIDRAIGENIRHGNAASDHLDAKSRLQALLQSRGEMPTYTLIAHEGPDHLPVFRYAVSVGNAVLGEGQGHSKQTAQTEAAKMALSALAAKKE